MAINVPAVSAGTPIEADWGNTVDLAVTELQNDKLNKSGGTMTGPLIVEQARVGARTGVSTPQALFSQKDAPGESTGFSCINTGAIQVIAAAGQYCHFYTRTGTLPNGTGHKQVGYFNEDGWSFNVPAMSNVAQTVAAPPAANHFIRKDYADDNYMKTTGAASMSGRLTIALQNDNLGLLIRSSWVNPSTGQLYNAPYLAMYSSNQSERYAYVQGTVDGLNIAGEGTGGMIKFLTGVGTNNASEKMRLNNTALLIGKTIMDANNPGVETYCTGTTLEGRLITTINNTNAAWSNLICRHVGTGTNGADNELAYYIVLQHGTTGVSAGWAWQGDGNNTVWYAGAGGSFSPTSDYRYKDDLGPVVDPVSKVMALQPKHLRWKEISGTSGEFDGFIAHEVTPIVPSAVVGEKDARHPSDHPMDPGGIDPQGLDPGKLVPVITAALQNIISRVEALEGAA